MTKKKIFVALSTFGEYGLEPLKNLESSGFDYTLNPLGKRLQQEEIIRMGKDCEGVIAGVEPYDRYVLENMPKLRCISRCGVGIDNIDLNEAKEKGVAIRNTPNVVIQPVVELTVGIVFDLLRKITYHAHLLKNRRWEKEAGQLLAGKTVGILGLGRIGKKVAQTMVKLDAVVIGSDIRPDQQWAKKNGVRLVPIKELLQSVDVLCLHLSAAADNPFQLGSQEIALMKEGAFVINVSRGQFIDEEALHAALREKRLGGAALDVFSKEPYRGKLCDLNNIILTPHVATLTRESRLQMEIEATKNLIEYFNTTDTTDSHA